MASRSRRSSHPVSTPSTICRAAMLITGRELTSQAGEKNVGRVVEHYGVLANPQECEDRIYGLGCADTGETTPVWSIAPESVIVAPTPQEALKLGVTCEIWGWAWADGEVSGVEIYASDHAAWRPAELEPRRNYEWQRFSFDFTPEHRGPLFLAARATTPAGQRQPLAGRRNAIHGVPTVVV